MTTEVRPAEPGPSSSAPQPRPAGRRSPTWWRGLREILLIVGLWLCYSLGRNLADQDAGAARSRAEAIYDAEKWLHIDVEHWLNHVIEHPATMWLGIVMCFWYAALHYTITPAVLAYVWIRHRDDYSRVRNALVIACAVALVVYIFLPTMPPRLMPAGYGYIDTMAQTARDGHGWWSVHASAPRGMSQLTNELAAMPSLHVGWTVWVAWVMRRHGNRLARGLGYFYVVGTSAVVFCTANHWILDVVAGIGLVLASIWLVNRVSFLHEDDGVLQVLRGGIRRLRRRPAHAD